MANVVAFKALRFGERVGNIEKLCCPPYDIISPDERAALVKTPHNIVNLELPEGENRYESAGEMFKKWREEGVLKLDHAAGMYVYEEEFSHKNKTYHFAGVIARLQLEEFSKGNILPHEETLSKAKEDRFALMERTMANFSQIYALYLDGEKTVTPVIDRIRDGVPEVSFTDGAGVTHKLWPVFDVSITGEITRGFKNKKLFIADGHHRYETALNFRDRLREQGVIRDETHGGNFVMTMLVDMDSDGLVIFPTHRLIRDIPNFDAKGFLETARERFNIKKTDADELERRLEECENSVAFYHAGECHIMTLKDDRDRQAAMPGASDAYRMLDVNLLHALILQPYFGIDRESMAQQKNLVYTRNLNEAISKVDSGEFQCSFILNPTKVKEIRDVASNGEKMPQKSTYFYPKLITGLVINSLCD